MSTRAPENGDGLFFKNFIDQMMNQKNTAASKKVVNKPMAVLDDMLKRNCILIILIVHTII